MAAEQNDDDVDSVRYAKKRRYLESSTPLKIRGRSCTDTGWRIVDLNILELVMIYWIQLIYNISITRLRGLNVCRGRAELL